MPFLRYGATDFACEILILTRIGSIQTPSKSHPLPFKLFPSSTSLEGPLADFDGKLRLPICFVVQRAFCEYEVSDKTHNPLRYIECAERVPHPNTLTLRHWLPLIESNTLLFCENLEWMTFLWPALNRESVLLLMSFK